MAEPQVSKLFVNVGASQARRRLKGFGHGVQKIQTAGNNQALIIHTATGRHLRELEAKFADVGYSGRENDLSDPIQSLKNIGSTSAFWLRQAGVRTLAELQRLGPVAAYRLVKESQPHVDLNLLWALAAGLRDQDWRDLSDAAKTQLLEELRSESTDP